MPEIRVIAVSGQKRNGKDELANYLAPKLNFGRASFAEPVKRIYCETFGVDIAFIDKWKDVPEPPPGMDMNVRKGLQFIGDGFRTIKSDIWVDLAFRKKENYLCKIFSDGRYVNEAKKTKQEKGFNFLVYRPGFLNDDENKSEAEIRPFVEWCNKTGEEGLIKEFRDFQSLKYDNFSKKIKNYDYFIKNEGTVKDFQNKIDNVVIPFLKENYEINL